MEPSQSSPRDVLRNPVLLERILSHALFPLDAERAAMLRLVCRAFFVETNRLITLHLEAVQAPVDFLVYSYRHSGPSCQRQHYYPFNCTGMRRSSQPEGEWNRIDVTMGNDLMILPSLYRQTMGSDSIFADSLIDVAHTYKRYVREHPSFEERAMIYETVGRTLSSIETALSLQRHFGGSDDCCNGFFDDLFPTVKKPDDSIDLWILTSDVTPQTHRFAAANSEEEFRPQWEEYIGCLRLVYIKWDGVPLMQALSWILPVAAAASPSAKSWAKVAAEKRRRQESK